MQTQNLDIDATKQPSTSENQSSLGTARFLQDLKTPGNQYIGFQSILDALDLWNSTVKLYFDAFDFKTSAQALNDWLAEPVGASIFFLGAAFLGGFAYLANGVSRANVNPISKTAEDYWPYLRDMLKGLKWTFKGTRSFMIVASLVAQYQFIRYLTPVGLGLGALSACNRIWNRGMVETRKTLQDKNNDFRKQVKGIHACFHEVEYTLVYDEDNNPRSDVLKHIYAGSILKIKADLGIKYFRVNLEGEMIELPLENYSFLSKLDNALEEIKRDLPSQNCVPRLYWDRYEGLINQSSTCDEVFKQVLKDKITHLKTLLNPNSESSKFLEQQAQFQQNAKQAFASATFSGLLNAPYYFLGLLSMVVLPHPIFIAAICVCSVFMALNVAAELYQENDYQRRLRISQLKANLVKTKRLLVIEWQHANYCFPNPSPISKDIARDSFEESSLTLLEDLEDDLPSNPSALRLQIRDVLKLLEQKVLSSPANKTSLELVVLILDSFQNERASNALKQINQEQQTELNHLYAQIDMLDSKFSELKLMPQDLLLIQNCIKIAKYERDYHLQYKQLHNQLRLSDGSVWWQGLRNGLVVFGAFNSLLMTIASMSFLFGIGFTPMFFYVSIISGITLLFFTTLYTLCFVHPKEEEHLAEDQDNHGVMEKDGLFISKSTQEIIDKKDIQASKNLLISEHSEVVRQLLSGFKKGIKFLQTISVYSPALLNNESLMTKTIYIGIGLVSASCFAMKGLRGLIKVEDKGYENSFMYNLMTGQAVQVIEKPKADDVQPKQFSPIKKMCKTKSQTIIQNGTEFLSRRASPKPLGSPRAWDDFSGPSL